MDAVRVFIVDDELLAQRRLERLIEDVAGFVHIGSAGSVNEARQRIISLKPEIILLDIHISGGTGFDVIANMPPPRPAVIFVSAFDNYALRAFEAKAMDYLTKPIGTERLREALARARTAIRARDNEDRISELQETVSALRQALGADDKSRSDLWIKSRGELVRVPAAAIIRVQAERDYVRIHMTDRSILHHESLRLMEERLDPQDFIRLHRSTMVRRECIVSFRQAPFGTKIAVLTDGTEVRVGRTYVRSLGKSSPV